MFSRNCNNSRLFSVHVNIVHAKMPNSQNYYRYPDYFHWWIQVTRCFWLVRRICLQIQGLEQKLEEPAAPIYFNILLNHWTHNQTWVYDDFAAIFLKSSRAKESNKEHGILKHTGFHINWTPKALSKMLIIPWIDKANHPNWSTGSIKRVWMKDKGQDPRSLTVTITSKNFLPTILE